MLTSYVTICLYIIDTIIVAVTFKFLYVWYTKYILKNNVFLFSDKGRSKIIRVWFGGKGNCYTYYFIDWYEEWDSKTLNDGNLY